MKMLYLILKLTNLKELGNYIQQVNDDLKNYNTYYELKMKWIKLNKF